MELIGKKVKHITFGVGTIRSYEDGKITVDFKSEKSTYPVFQFPKAFDKFLSFVEEDDQKQLEMINTDIKKSVISIEDSKEAQMSGQINASDKTDSLVIGNTVAEVIPEKKHPRLTMENLKTLKVPYNVEDDYQEIERILKLARDDIESMESPIVKPKRPLNYSDKWNRGAYALRYYYAYIFEYINLFLDLIDLGVPDEEIKIMSIGCGAKIDAWALQEALKIQRIHRKVLYTGIDKEDWSRDGYCPNTETHIVDDSTTFNCCAGKYLMGSEKLDYDIYLFPKSIGDIYYFDTTGEAFDRIKRAFENKEIKKDCFYIAASTIRYEDGAWDDIAALEEVKKSTEKNHFVCTGSYVNESINRYIVDYRNYVRYPEYPPAILPDVERLTGYKPTFSRSRERYLIFKFEKVRG